jgi:hypothetical protein
MPAAEPFPGIGFQITIQEIPIDDLPCYEQEQTDPRFGLIVGNSKRKSTRIAF